MTALTNYTKLWRPLKRFVNEVYLPRKYNEPIAFKYRGKRVVFTLTQNSSLTIESTEYGYHSIFIPYSEDNTLYDGFFGIKGSQSSYTMYDVLKNVGYIGSFKVHFDGLPPSFDTLSCHYIHT